MKSKAVPHPPSYPWAGYVPDPEAVLKVRGAMKQYVCDHHPATWKGQAQAAVRAYDRYISQHGLPKGIRLPTKEKP